MTKPKNSSLQKFCRVRVSQPPWFPEQGGSAQDTFVIVDAHVHIPVICSLLIKVCQEKGNTSFGDSCGSLTQKSCLMVARIPILSNKMGRKRY